MRVLNAAQSTLSHWGALVGHEFSWQAAADEVLSGLVERMLARETLPTLPAIEGVARHAYLAASLARIRNTAIRHRCHQIGTDGSQKIASGCSGLCARGACAASPARDLECAVAGWIAYVAAGAKRYGARWRPSDPFAEPIIAQAQERKRDLRSSRRPRWPFHTFSATISPTRIWPPASAFISRACSDRIRMAISEQRSLANSEIVKEDGARARIFPARQLRRASRGSLVRNGAPSQAPAAGGDFPLAASRRGRAGHGDERRGRGGGAALGARALRAEPSAFRASPSCRTCSNRTSPGAAREPRRLRRRDTPSRRSGAARRGLRRSLRSVARTRRREAGHGSAGVDGGDARRRRNSLSGRIEAGLRRHQLHFALARQSGHT